MNRILIVLIALLLAIPSSAMNDIVDVNSAALVGTWDILDANNTTIDSIEVEIAISKKNTARFSYRQISHDDPGSSLEGFLLGDIVIFDLIDLGSVKTYIARVDFALGGGPGVEVATQLADCTVVGINEALVKKKHKKLLAADSAQCDSSTLNDSVSRDIKLVKQGVTATTIPSTATVDQILIDNQLTTDNKLSGAWLVRAGKGRRGNRRIIIKDPAATHLGYRFNYRLINNSTKLGNLTQTDFLSGIQEGFFIDDYLIFTTSIFQYPDQLFIIKINKKSGVGREIKTYNGDCFPLKEPQEDMAICTPNKTSLRTSSDSKRFDNRKIKKSNTKVTISF